MQIKLARLILRLIAGLAVVTVACGFQYAYITDPATGLPQKWVPGTIPMLIMVDNTTKLSDGNTQATTIQAAMQDAARGWNPRIGDVQFAPQILPPGKGAAQDNLSQIFFSSTPYNQAWDSNTVAVTTSWYQGRKRVESDIIFNPAMTWDSYRGAVRSGVVDLQRVAFRELGRVLGLDDPAAAGLTADSIMSSQVSDFDQPQNYDIKAAQFLYGPLGVPANDNLAAATHISLIANAATVKGYNTNATKEAGEPNHANNVGGRSVWWQWPATSSGTLTVTTVGSTFDTNLGIYTGTDVTALTSIAANDDVQSGVNLTSTVTFPVLGGTTYYIAVDGSNTGDANGADSGGIVLNFTFVPTYSVLNETVAAGHSVTFAVAAGTGTVQWQVSTNNGVTWFNITDNGSYSGSTTPNLTITNVSSGVSGFRYRAVVTDSNGATSPSVAGSLIVTQSVLSFPTSITIDALGNLYVGDTSLETVQEITSKTTLSALAGSTSDAGSADGLGTIARFNQPSGLSANPAGFIGVADTANATIRAIKPDGTVTTLAGNPSTHGSADGTGSAASFSSPIGIACDASGTFYVADAMNHTIRKVTTGGVVTTVAGSAGAAGYADSTGAAARFNYPTGIAVDGSGNVYVADTTNNLLRMISPTGAVTTIAGVVGVAGTADGTGASALFNMPGGLAVDPSGNVYLADTGNSTIRKITPGGVVTTLAGVPGVAGYKDGNAGEAWFNQPKSLVLDTDGNVYVTDTGNAAIREITPAGVVSTLSLSSASATTSTSTTSTSSTIPPTDGTTTTTPTTGGGGGGAPSTWFFGALGLLSVLRKLSPKRG